MAKTERPALVLTVVLAAIARMPSAALAEAASSRPAGDRLNILLITADDLGYDGLGVTGCPLSGISPNIDKLASQSLRFEHAHVTAAVCQPSRSALMTGRYPHRNGAMGFEPIRDDVPTLQESLSQAGYMNGIMAKVPHLQPEGKFRWDSVVTAPELGQGRGPDLYYQYSKAFFKKASAAGRPFFLMANSQDPHRPFAGADQDKVARRRGRQGDPGSFADPGVTYAPQDVPVPLFLPDLPPVRRELAQYYASVHRCDQTVGQILRALAESGLEESTLVMFLSDNGMAFPFAKTNCYRFSTRTPWIVRWPKRVKFGVDSKHFISGIDFTPTILQATGLAPMAGVDGRSFLPVLLGREQEGRDSVFTVFHETSGKRQFPMRAVQNSRFGLIFNAWSDGKLVFQSESTGSPSYKGMVAAAVSDPKVRERVKMLDLRVPEELYDYQADPGALHNLIGDSAYTAQRDRLRREMLEVMKRSKDPLLEPFEKHVAKAG